MLLRRTTRLAIVFLGGLTLFAPEVPAEENSCLECHTSGAELIKITRRLHQTEPDQEARSKGPG